MFSVTLFDPKTLSWWNAQRKKIDMDPPYQRKGRLWSKADKAFLIDSILNDYDIPKVYVADFTFGGSPLNRKKLAYAIIDGKQRLEAIFDFYDGTIVLNETFSFLEEPSLRLGGLGYPDLLKNYPEVARKFDNFSLTVMRVVSNNEDQISELFVRLNRSKPLTGAEIRNAMRGPAPKMIREIVKHEFFADTIAFSAVRGQDQNAAAKLLLFEYQIWPKETKKSNLDRFVKDAASDRHEKIEVSARRVLDGLDRMSDIFLPHDSLLRSAGIVPVYYWFISQLPIRDDSKVREFIVEFERLRKDNRELARDKGPRAKVEQDLLDFDSYNRSTNDQKSHEERTRILRARFDRYTARKPKRSRVNK